MKKILILLMSLILILNFYLLYMVRKFDNNFKEKNSLIIENHVNGFHTDLTKTFKDINKKIAYIQTVSGIGTGFIYKQIDNKVYIVTSFHNIKDHLNFTLSIYNQKHLPSILVGYDEVLDLAVIEAELDYQVDKVKVGNSDLLKQGEYVVAVGAIENLEFKDALSFGIVSNPSRRIVKVVDDKEYIVDTCLGNINLNRGFSGGPLFNQFGELVAVVNYRLENQNNYVLTIPINEAGLVIDKIISEVKVQRLGLELYGLNIKDMDNIQKSNLNLDISITNGVYVEEVLPDSFAKKIGIIKSDVVTSINDVEIDSYSKLRLFNYLNTDNLKINIIRNHESLTLEGKIND